jgi:hypothetical protein
MSKQAFFARYPNGVAPKNKAELLEYNKCIVCRRGVNQVQGRYTEEFLWEEVYDENDILKLISLVKDGLKAARKRKTTDNDVSCIWKMAVNVLTLIQSSVCRDQRGNRSSFYSQKATETGPWRDSTIATQEGTDDTNS